MNGKFILYAVLVSILCTTASWGRIQSGPASNAVRSGSGAGAGAGGSSWSSNTGGGSWSGGNSSGGHK